MTHILHIAFASDWKAAQAAGEYRMSTRGATLDDVGFIHCSFAEQVLAIGQFLYAGVGDDLVVLVVDTDRVPSEIRIENLDGGETLFPHIYGPLPVEAVLWALPFRREGGSFRIDWSPAAVGPVRTLPLTTVEDVVRFRITEAGDAAAPKTAEP